MDNDEYQGKGFSKKLLKSSPDFSKNKGCRVKPEVHMSNSRAIEPYRKAGFTSPGDYDVFMIRDLSKLLP